MSASTATPDAVVAPPKPEADETTAGNYFVSNYPPYSFWKPEFVSDFNEAIERPPAEGQDLGLYVHIPFCRKRCHFCYFRVYTDKNAAAINAYLDRAVDELEIYAKKPFLGGRKPSFVYFGGGTPSYLSVSQLTSFTDRLKRILPWDEAEEIAFECEPGTLNDKKLKAIRDIGVTRLSLGIENFDDRILEINGRAHRSPEVSRAYEYAKEIGFQQINIDLIAGMIEETEDNWKRCVEKTIEMAPESVTIYEMEIPYNTTIYQRMQAEGKLVAPVAGWETKRRWVDYAFKELEKVGYTVGSAYTAVKSKEDVQFLYRDRLFAGSDLLSLGVASFGSIGGTHYQNQHNFEPYIEALEKGELPVYRALTPTAEEALIRELILLLKLGQVSRSYFQDKHGVDIVESFAAQMKILQDSGYLTIDGDTVKLNREGLLQVDQLMHEFFLPKHRNQRYA
ncbi:MAG: oxygen-independent coproporphyrinogen-3 oxidase [Limisphaerales bacterium]|jgi:oxygen-independent coproporphyrinogen-3 oxidase